MTSTWYKELNNYNNCSTWYLWRRGQDIRHDIDNVVDSVPAAGSRTTVNTIRYDSMYLTCSKKLTGSQLSLPHVINKKLKCKTKKNDERDRSGPVPLS